MTKLAIINKALIRIGQRPLQSVDEDSNDARLVNVVFSSTVEETLREGAFHCTIKRTKLAQTIGNPLFPEVNTFALPADSLRIMKCFVDNPNIRQSLNVEWELEGTVIISPSDVLYCKYVSLPKDLSILDSLSARAVSLQLALQLSYVKTESIKLTNSILTEYETLMLQKAKSFSSMEANNHSNFAEVDWVESRRINW